MSNHILKLAPNTWKARLLAVIRAFRETRARVLQNYQAGRSLAGRTPFHA